MATSNVIAHKNLTDPQLHEPKGISAANEGAVYVANGVGSGVWEALPFRALDYTPMSVADITGYTTIDIDTVPTEEDPNPNYVVPVDFSDISGTTSGAVQNVEISAEATFDKANVNTALYYLNLNIKEAGEELTQLRTAFKNLIDDVEAIKTAHEDLRTNLITSGIITAPTP